MTIGLESACRIAFPGILVGVTVACLIPGVAIGHTGFHDKITHALAYLVIGGIARLGFPSPRAEWRLFLFIVAWGILIEVGQYFVPGRSFEFADMLANAAGLSVAFILFRSLYPKNA